MPGEAHGRAAKRSSGGDVGHFSRDGARAGSAGSQREVGGGGLSTSHGRALRAAIESAGTRCERVSSRRDAVEHIAAGAGSGGAAAAEVNGGPGNRGAGGAVGDRAGDGSGGSRWRESKVCGGGLSRSYCHTLRAAAETAGGGG